MGGGRGSGASEGGKGRVPLRVAVHGPRRVRQGLAWSHLRARAALLTASLAARPQEQKSILAMEGIMEGLCKSGSLFEVAVPDYKQLKACHREVRLLKELWDMIVMVSGRGAGAGAPVGASAPGGGAPTCKKCRNRSPGLCGAPHLPQVPVGGPLSAGLCVSSSGRSSLRPSASRTGGP